MLKGELAPGTLEGWYALHQMVTVDWQGLRALGSGAVDVARETAALLQELAEPVEGGWSAAYQLVGGGADVMFLHFRPTLDQLGAAELRLRRSRAGAYFHVKYDFTSVTEAGLYHATAQAAQQAEPRSKEFYRLLEEEAAAERASPHVQTRLYPVIAPELRYVSFYPMSKRRSHPDNWYALPVAERNMLMREHGLTGRTYAGRVFQVITGSTGLDDWEWGVTLFAADPLEFKRIVTEMRYDVASTRFGEFGEFFTGFKLSNEELVSLLTPA
jgi:hydrogen peroxide-dependent heme synthase